MDMDSTNENHGVENRTAGLAAVVLQALPRVLAMNLAGREPRAVVRLARILGFPGVVVMGAGVPPRELARSGECTSLATTLRVDDEIVVLLSAAKEIAPDDADALRAAATVVFEVGQRQAEAQVSSAAVSAIDERGLRGELRRLRRLDELFERIEPITAGAKELLRAAAEVLSAELNAVAVALLRPPASSGSPASRDSAAQVWLARTPGGTTFKAHELAARAGFEGTRDGVHEVDAALCRATHEPMHMVVAAPFADAVGGEQLVMWHQGDREFHPWELEFLDTVGQRTLNALGEREHVGRILDRARTLQQKLDQVVASHRIARTLRSTLNDEQAMGRIVWDVRESFQTDAAVFVYESSQRAHLCAVASVEGGEEQERQFLAYAKRAYEQRYESTNTKGLLVRRSVASTRMLTAEFLEPLDGVEDQEGDDTDAWPTRLTAPLSLAHGPALLCLGARRPRDFGAEAEAALQLLAGEAAEGLGQLYGMAKREQRLLEQLVEHLPTSVIMVGPHREVRVVNPAARRLLRSSTRPDHLDDLEESSGLALSRLLEEADEGHGELSGREIVWGEQNPRYLRADVSRVFGDGGSDVGWLMTIRDISRVKRLELEQAEFVSTVSHELRTPLTSMKTAIEIVSQGESGPVSEEQTHFLEMTLRNLDRLGRLIQQLLDVARQEAGRLHLQPQPNNVTHILRDVLLGFQRNAERQGRTLGCEVPEDVQGYVDSDRFPEIVENLVGNAMKFTDTGGRIDVNIRVDVPCPDKQAVELAYTLGQSVRGFELTVGDDGAGMDPSAQAQVFERFFQEGDPLVGRPQGAGLGLTITRALVQAHGGFIDMHSELDMGTTMTVWIPSTKSDADIPAALLRLRAAMADVSQHLDAGRIGVACLVPSGPEVASTDRASLVADVEARLSAWAQPDTEFEWLGPRVVAWLTGPGEAPEGHSQGRTRDLSGDLRVGWGAFPEEGTDVGTLLALAHERAGREVPAEFHASGRGPAASDQEVIAR